MSRRGEASTVRHADAGPRARRFGRVWKGFQLALEVIRSICIAAPRSSSRAWGVIQLDMLLLHGGEEPRHFDGRSFCTPGRLWVCGLNTTSTSAAHTPHW